MASHSALRQCHDRRNVGLLHVISLQRAGSLAEVYKTGVCA